LTIQFYHKPVRSCSILSKKKSEFMRTVAFRKRLNRNGIREGFTGRKARNAT